MLYPWSTLTDGGLLPVGYMLDINKLFWGGGGGGGEGDS